ncbi:MAG: hypothetical protein KDG50_03310 [Chromatiales bacterium]|nr:hypothetical protein [Chromatiales bacterium]
MSTIKTKVFNEAPGLIESVVNHWMESLASGPPTGMDIRGPFLYQQGKETRALVFVIYQQQGAVAPVNLLANRAEQRNGR